MPDPANRELVKYQKNKRTGEIRAVYSDGSVEMMPGEGSINSQVPPPAEPPRTPNVRPAAPDFNDRAEGVAVGAQRAFEAAIPGYYQLTDFLNPAGTRESIEGSASSHPVASGVGTATGFAAGLALPFAAGKFFKANPIPVGLSRAAPSAEVVEGLHSSGWSNPAARRAAEASERALSAPTTPPISAGMTPELMSTAEQVNAADAARATSMSRPPSDTISESDMMLLRRLGVQNPVPGAQGYPMGASSLEEAMLQPGAMTTRAEKAAARARNAMPTAGIPRRPPAGPAGHVTEVVSRPGLPEGPAQLIKAFGSPQALRQAIDNSPTVREILRRTMGQQ